MFLTKVGLVGASSFHIAIHDLFGFGGTIRMESHRESLTLKIHECRPNDGK